MNKIRAVIFDFDGTLTKSNENIWKKLYLKLGLLVDKNSNYYKSYIDFINKKYDYQSWVKVNEDDFKKGGLTESIFYEIAGEYELFNGVIETIKLLRKQNIKLYILSGNFVQAIKYILGENKDYFNDVSANNIYFDNSSFIKEITPTIYDFEGKATYIKNIMINENLSPEEVCFVGNGDNDIYAYRAGVKTICINPVNAKEDDEMIWSNVIKNCKNLEEILKFIVK